MRGRSDWRGSLELSFRAARIINGRTNGLFEEGWNACLCSGRQGGCDWGRKAVQEQMWINLKAEGCIRRSTHVSKCVSCYSACQITLCIDNLCSVLRYGCTNWRIHIDSRFSQDCGRALEKQAVASSCLSIRLSLHPRGTWLPPDGFERKMIMESCTEMFLHLQISVKLRHEWQAPYIETCAHLWPLWLLTLPRLPVSLRLLCSPLLPRLRQLPGLPISFAAIGQQTLCRHIVSFSL